MLTKPAQAPKITNKTKCNVEETCAKTKKQPFWQLVKGLGSIVLVFFVFFLNFFWCLCRFGANPGLFFLVSVQLL